MTQVWPASLAMRESIANARASRWMATLVIVSAAWASTAVGLTAAVETGRLYDAEQAWIEAGGYAFVVEPGVREADEPLSVATCERLNDVDGVRGAFAAEVSNQALEPATAPGTRATLVSVSPGIYRMLDLLPPATAGVIATESATDDTGLRDGEHTTFRTVDFTSSSAGPRFDATVSVADSPLLGENLAGAYLLPTLTDGSAHQCYVLSDAAHADSVETYLNAALATADGTPPIVRPRLSDHTYGLDFATAYSTSIMRWAWVAGAAALFALWAAVRWTRRTQIAVYATFGVHARARLLMQVTEWTVLSGLGASWGWATAVTFAVGLGVEPHVAIAQVSLQIVALWCAATLGVVVLGLAPVGTLLDALKDRS